MYIKYIIDYHIIDLNFLNHKNKQNTSFFYHRSMEHTFSKDGSTVSIWGIATRPRLQTPTLPQIWKKREFLWPWLYRVPVCPSSKGCEREPFITRSIYNWSYIRPTLLLPKLPPAINYIQARPWTHREQRRRFFYKCTKEPVESHSPGFLSVDSPCLTSEKQKKLSRIPIPHNMLSRNKRNILSSTNQTP